MVDRFHVVVSNFRRLHCFAENFGRIQGFDGERDRVYVLDCSPEEEYPSELAKVDALTQRGLEWGRNLFFIRRRNWGVNHGAQLDYLRCLRNLTVPLPRYVAFMQDHYLDLNEYVNVDTIPPEAVYDLNSMADRFNTDSRVGCIFHARLGARISCSNPRIRREVFGDADALLDGASKRCLLVDGGNFVVRPQLYLEWFRQHPRYLTRGNGSYGFSHVWEVRLGNMLYQQRIKWFDACRGIEFATVEELEAAEIASGRRASKLWYDNRVWFFFYGRDMRRYLPLPLDAVWEYLAVHLRSAFRHDRNTLLRFIEPDPSSGRPRCVKSCGK